MAQIALTLAPVFTVALTLVSGSTAFSLDAAAPAPHSITLLPATPTVLTAVAELMRGPRGAAGPIGIDSPPIVFGFGDASPRILFIAPAQALVLRISIAITTPFNGAAPALQIGTAQSPELLIAADHIDLSADSRFEYSPDVVLGAAQPVILTLTPGAGATQGSGWVVFEQIPAT